MSKMCSSGQAFQPPYCEELHDLLALTGIALHSFWHGDEQGAHQGLRFEYYKVDTLKALIGSDYEFLEARQYSEIASDDSLCIVLRK